MDGLSFSCSFKLLLASRTFITGQNQMSRQEGKKVKWALFPWFHLGVGKGSNTLPTDGDAHCCNRFGRDCANRSGERKAAAGDRNDCHRYGCACQFIG